MHPLLQLILTIIVCAFAGCLWGAATYTINQNKGYYENGFWWGFWLGWIGLVIVLCKQDINRYSYYPASRQATNQHAIPSDKPHPAIASQPVPNGGWQCACGRVHAAYVSSCACGKSKIPAPSAEAEPIIEPNMKTGEPEERIIALLKEYKALLDCGAITQEEFDNKKKQLLDK